MRMLNALEGASLKNIICIYLFIHFVGYNSNIIKKKELVDRIFLPADEWQSLSEGNINLSQGSLHRKDCDKWRGGGHITLAGPVFSISFSKIGKAK